jgi:hypothetical protein
MVGVVRVVGGSREAGGGSKKQHAPHQESDAVTHILFRDPDVFASFALAISGASRPCGGSF